VCATNRLNIDSRTLSLFSREALKSRLSVCRISRSKARWRISRISNNISLSSSLVWAAIQGSSQAHNARRGSRLKWRSIASLTMSAGSSSFRARPCRNAKCRSRFDDELALHPSMMPTAMHAAAERISTGRLRHKFHRLRLSFLDFRAVLRRREHQTGISFRVDTVGHFADLESMGVVDCADPELNPCALPDSNARRGKLVFLCRYVDGLNTFRKWNSIGIFGRSAAR